MGQDWLIDTNLLLYQYDPRDAAKQQRATAVVARLVDLGNAALSVQVLNEFFSACTTKLPEKLQPSEALLRLEHFRSTFEIFDLTSTIAFEAARGVRDHQLAFWDALIWATARLNQVPGVLSEDFRGRRALEGVRFVNPLVPTFDLAHLEV